MSVKILDNLKSVLKFLISVLTFIVKGTLCRVFMVKERGSGAGEKKVMKSKRNQRNQMFSDLFIYSF